MPRRAAKALTTLARWQGRLRRLLPVPEDYQPPFLPGPPAYQFLQELHRLLSVAPAVLPLEAFPMAEVVSAVAVQPLGQLGAIALTPDPFADASPGGAEV